MIRYGLIALALMGCKDKDAAGPKPASVIMGVPMTGGVHIDGLEGRVEVLYDKFGVPTIYGETEADVAHVHGYVIARDRFFFLDLTRRVGKGTTTELLGDDGLESDIESRQRGMIHVTDQIMEELENAPEVANYMDGYAAGINAFIADVRAGELDPPAEFELLGPFIGVDPIDALEEFDRRDIAASMAFLVFETAWEPGDVSRANDVARFETLFDGAPLEALRKAGARPDVFDRMIPPVDAQSAPDWASGGGPPSGPPANASRAPRPPSAMLADLEKRLDHAVSKMGKDRSAGFGSNTWAVSGDHTASGNALLAADPHLPLSIPAVMWLVGLDTKELGGGDLHVIGHQATPLLFMASGTNGDIAWGQTNAGGGDITDWYSEIIELDASGAPSSSLFQGAQHPLVSTVDTYVIADVPALGSVGRTEDIPRYQTFDGRWLNAIEGRDVDGPEDAGPGETAVNMMGQWVIPEDIDGIDGITAVSFDYTGFDMHGMGRAIEGTLHATDLADFIDVTEDFVAYGLQIVAADSSGSILYTPYMAMPCRSYLPRNPDGSFIDGADPKMLLDGTQYGAFEVPADAEGHVDFGQSDDPARCLVPWEEHPWSIDPDQGFLASANADPGGQSLDNDLTNDAYYIGGPWLEGFRQGEINDELADLVAAGGIDVEDMRVLQSNHDSVLGKWLGPVLVDAIDAARAARDAGETADAAGRIAAIYDADSARFDDVQGRMLDWESRGFKAESGVKTFYDGTPTAEQKADAVATTIFNAWMGPFVNNAVNDEGMPKGDHGTYGMIRMMLESRGPGNPGGFASYNPATEESVYWDILSTPDVETSEEIAVLALVGALDFLESEPDDGAGGFGTADADEWLWGLKHWVVMEPLLLELLGSDFLFLLQDFQIDQKVFPMDDDIGPGDHRADVPGFPRHSDHKNVDAANSGSNGMNFDNSYGPTARMVVELHKDGARGINSIPGGQSSDPDSEHFSDLAKLWLANDTLPISTVPADAAHNAVRRESFAP